MKLFKKTPALLGMALTALLVAAPAAQASAPLLQDGEEAEEADDEEEEEDEGDKLFAIQGADIYTGNGEVLRGATIFARNGKIREIGYDVYLPEGTQVLTGVEGMRIYPGLVAFESSGLLGGTSDFGNTVDPFNSRMVLALGGGITSTGQSSAAAKLKRFSIDGVVLNERAFSGFSWTTRNPATKRSTREKFEGAAKYLRKYRQWEEDVKKDKDLKEPSKRGVDSSALAVLKGEVLAKFSATDRDDLLGIAQLAQRYGFRPVIEGAGEGWTVAEELGRAGAMCVITPRYRRSKDERLVTEGGSSIENAAILHAAGCQVAIVPQSTGIDLGGIAGRDIMHLPIEAGFAIRGGLPQDAALEAITIVPARMLGVDHRVGSLEVGKDCDLIVTDGDLFHYETFVQFAVVDGRIVYDKQEELYYAHIRPRAETELAPVTKVDPGEEAVEEEGDGDEGDDEDEDKKGDEKEGGDK